MRQQCFPGGCRNDPAAVLFFPMQEGCQRGNPYGRGTEGGACFQSVELRSVVAIVPPEGTDKSLFCLVTCAVIACAMALDAHDGVLHAFPPRRACLHVTACAPCFEPRRCLAPRSAYQQKDKDVTHQMHVNAGVYGILPPHTSANMLMTKVILS